MVSVIAPKLERAEIERAKRKPTESSLSCMRLEEEEPDREPWQLDELKAFFSSPVFTEGLRPTAGRGEAAYWLPLLALFTGARLGELAPLTVADITTDKPAGISTIRVTEDLEQGRRLKNVGSRRARVHAVSEKGPARGGAFCRSLRRCSLHRDHGDDHVRDRVYDHEFVIVDEAQVTAKFRLNEHDVLRNHEEVEPPWNSHAYIDIEVHIAYPKPRYEPAVKNHVLYPRPLLSGERNMALRTSLREPVRAGAAGRSQVLPVHAPSFAEPAAPLFPESMAGPSPFTRRCARASTDAAVLPVHARLLH